MAKRSRRERRQESNKPGRDVGPSTSVSSDGKTDRAAAETKAQPTSEAARPEPTNGRKSAVNFGQEYFYVYQEVRTICIVAIAMFIVLVGLSFVI